MLQCQIWKNESMVFNQTTKYENIAFTKLNTLGYFIPNLDRDAITQYEIKLEVSGFAFVI